MNSATLKPTLAVLILIGVTAGLISSLRSRQTLGQPGLPIAKVALHDEEGAVARPESIQFPKSIPGFTFTNSPVSKTELDYLPRDTTFGRGQYTSEDGSWSAAVSAVLMGTDRTSIHRPEYCLQGVGWEVGQPRVQQIHMPDGSTLDVQRIDTLGKQTVGGRQMEVAGVYVFWFVADGQRTASHWKRQSAIIRDLLTKNSLPRWAYVSFLTTCLPGQEDDMFEKVSGLIAKCEPLLTAKPAALALGTDAAGKSLR